MFNIFRGKTVLVTGHTGFKGSWLSVWLKMLGADVKGLSIGFPTNPCNFEACQISKLVDSHIVDIRDYDETQKLINAIQPDFVFHLAAEALVRTSYSMPLKCMYTNALGTVNVLEALRNYNNDVVAIMVTSDKVYDNSEWVWGYRENDRIGGGDPYSASKGMAELAIKSYCSSFFGKASSNIKIGIVRAGNVIGGGDWAADRVVPDCMRAWSNGASAVIRAPNATRPWQHVLEPLSGYLCLARKMSSRVDLSGQAYNFGPPAEQNFTVKSLVEELIKYWPRGEWSDGSLKGQEEAEATLLKLNCDKALHELNWKPTLDFAQTVHLTGEWYKKFYESNGSDMLLTTKNQIETYSKLMGRLSES